MNAEPRRWDQRLASTIKPVTAVGLRKSCVRLGWPSSPSGFDLWVHRLVIEKM
jgi:hypothetical protein